MENLLFEGWGISAVCTEQIQNNVWKINTEIGDLALKRSELKKKNLEFICQAERSLVKHGFERFAKLIPDQKGNLYFQAKDGAYTLHQWVHGKKCDFQNIRHLYAAADTLGEFHLRGKEHSLKEIHCSRTNYFDRAERLHHRIEELYHFYESSAVEEQTLFSDLYQSYYPQFSAKARKAEELLLRSEYPRLAAEAKAMGSFIHYDVAARNFMIQKDAAYLIDFDYCCCDIPLTDLMRLIKRGLKSGENDREKITAILDGYQKHRTLSKAEFEVLFALLLFPQKFWRIAHRYYAERKIHKEEFYVHKLSTAIKELEKEEDWLPLLEEKSEEYH